MYGLFSARAIISAFFAVNRRVIHCVGVAYRFCPSGECYFVTNAFDECLRRFYQRSSNYTVGIKSPIFQLRSKNKIFDFQSLMSKPTLHPRTLIFLKHRVHWSSVNEVAIELRASNVIECAHVSGKGGFVCLIELLVNTAKGFQEMQHDSC